MSGGEGGKDSGCFGEKLTGFADNGLDLGMRGKEESRILYILCLG